MFSLAAISISTHHRASPAHLLSQRRFATAGLLLVIFSLARSKRANTIPAAVGAYIGAAYFFTSSASFANPAIGVGRMFSNTFAGHRPGVGARIHRGAAHRRGLRDHPRESSLSGGYDGRGTGDPSAKRTLKPRYNSGDRQLIGTTSSSNTARIISGQLEWARPPA
jgi:hypothetical protein